MSRIGKKAVSVPKGVKVAVSDRTVSVEGPKGKLSFTHHPIISVSVDESNVQVGVGEGVADSRDVRAQWGTTRALIQNMVTGVTQGYSQQMKIVGVGWSAAVSGSKLRLAVGYANQIMLDIPAGVNIQVEKDIVTVSGADKHAVGQFCARMFQTKKPEPYNGKGIHYANRAIRRKEGKKVK